MRISVWVSAGTESIRRIPRTVLQRGPLKSGLRREGRGVSGETVIGSRCWPEKAIEEVGRFWKILRPQSSLSGACLRRPIAGHQRAIWRASWAPRLADRGRREQMSWERRANSQTKPSKREVKTFDPEQSLHSASCAYIRTCTQCTCANMCLESHTVVYESTWWRLHKHICLSQTPNITLLMWVLQAQKETGTCLFITIRA